MELELGKRSRYVATYSPDMLYPIAREGKRVEIGIDPQNIPFWGYDSWNHYEVSWLNPKGKPMVALAEISYECHSPNIIESKSMKLYFNSLNNSHFESAAVLEQVIKKDIAQRVGAEVYVRIFPLGSETITPLHVSFAGESLDHQDIACTEYQVNPNLLHASNQIVEETLYSDLLKSNCLVTFQPDWGSVLIKYKGPKIDRAGLLQYIVSFRNHNEFHEQCIERIYMDLLNRCHPTELTVYGRYTRRGGLDINPYRSSKKVEVPESSIRLIRQ